MREIKELNTWRDIPCSWISRLNIVEMSVLLDLLNGCNVIPVKVPANYYVDIHKLTLKFTWRGKKKKKSQDSQHNIEEQSWRTDSNRLQDLLESYRDQDILSHWRMGIFLLPGHLASDKTPEGQVLVNEFLLRASLFRKNRVIWHISKWFFFPSRQKHKDFSPVLTMRN